MQALIAGCPSPATTPVAAEANVCAHDLHLTYTRLEIGRTTATARVRIFHDDLQTVLARFSGRPSVPVTATTPQDSLFGEYFRRQVRVRNEAGPLSARVVSSGPDTTAVDVPMWWYEVELTAATPIGWLGLRYELMYDLFDDQRNILTIRRTSTGERSSMYFAAGDLKEQSITLNARR